MEWLIYVIGAFVVYEIFLKNKSTAPHVQQSNSNLTPTDSANLAQNQSSNLTANTDYYNNIQKAIALQNNTPVVTAQQTNMMIGNMSLMRAANIQDTNPDWSLTNLAGNLILLNSKTQNYYIIV